ncbi:MAG: SAM-dependent methyltransferase, partial [Nanoarchaeota archaeon]|nr:SAM-dependent methyltransferase [Nanoarchaeota archaeon]
IAIELPPFLQNIPLVGEREYLSVHGALSRLTLYCGTLAKAERSVVLLPGGERLESAKKKTKLPVAKAFDGFSYLYDINPAILQAGLLGEANNIAGNKLELYTSEKKQYFCSKIIVKSPFLRAYEILAVVPRETSEIRKQLQQLNAGKVILRQSLDPQEYWKERKKYEAGLTGKRMVSLFMLDKAVIAETVAVNS